MKQEHTGLMLEFLRRAASERIPVLLVSYERASADGAGLVSGLIDFFGIEVDDATHAAGVAAVDRRHGYGTLDGRPPR